ncbi:MAG: DUF979 family protein, partial [Burkholderiaceae bacterium]|nr:DUF979 family protein [Burkholderiaceae bacterium]
MIVKLDWFIVIVGLLLLSAAVMALFDKHNPRRYTSALFWGLYAAIYLAGEQMPPVAVGLLMVLMALLAGFGGVALGRHSERTPEQRSESAHRLGHRLLIPALIIPVTTMIGSTLLKDVHLGDVLLLDPKNLTLVS